MEKVTPWRHGVRGSDTATTSVVDWLFVEPDFHEAAAVDFHDIFRAFELALAEDGDALSGAAEAARLA